MTDFIIEDIGSIINGGLSYKWEKKPLISPVTGKEWGKIANATPEEVEQALETVQKNPVIRIPPYGRAQILELLAIDLLKEKEDIAEWITMEMGKPNT